MEQLTPKDGGLASASLRCKPDSGPVLSPVLLGNPSPSKGTGAGPVTWRNGSRGRGLSTGPASSAPAQPVPRAPAPPSITRRAGASVPSCSELRFWSAGTSGWEGTHR